MLGKLLTGTWRVIRIMEEPRRIVALVNRAKCQMVDLVLISVEVKGRARNSQMRVAASRMKPTATSFQLETTNSKVCFSEP